MIVGLSDEAWLRLNPAHPGGLLKRGVLDAFEEYPGMSVKQAAEKLGVSRVNLSRVLNERAPITFDLAMKLEAVGWGTADAWLKLQLKFDIARERKRLNRPLAEAPAAKAVKELLQGTGRKAVRGDRKRSQKGTTAASGARKATLPRPPQPATQAGSSA